MKQPSIQTEILLSVVFHVGIDHPPARVNGWNTEVGRMIARAQMQQQRGPERVIEIQPVQRRGNKCRQRGGQQPRQSVAGEQSRPAKRYLVGLLEKERKLRPAADYLVYF